MAYQFDCQTLTFYVNGTRVEDGTVDPRTTLAVYLRDKLNLRGTKIGCNEGGCGACTVMLSDLDPENEKIRHYSVNSCLTPVCSVFGKAVTTVEGISAGKQRLHPVQERLSLAHGSQCGYCTPGFVMAMYTLLRNVPEPTQAEVDECLQGNLCRCTGYRPILEAFYSFTKSSKNSKNDNAIVGAGCGIQDCCMLKKKKIDQQQNGYLINGEIKTLHKLCDLDSTQLTAIDASQELIFPPELVTGNWHKTSFAIELDGYSWYQPVTMEHLLALKSQYPTARLMAGNTEIGVELKFRHIDLKTVISVKQVPELRNHWVDAEGIWLGSGMSLKEVKRCLQTFGNQIRVEKSRIFEEICKMVHLFAGQHVRNMATIAGNIATASPISDLNPIWMASGAKILLESAERGKRIVTLTQDFFPSYRKTLIAPDEVLTAIHVPFSIKNQFFRAYKQAQRREDDIAIVTGVFSAKFLEPGILDSMQMAFGGMGPTTRLAIKSVEGLKGRKWDEKLFTDLSEKLAMEFRLDEDVPGGMAKYRQALVLSFLLKFYLYVTDELYHSRSEKMELHGIEEENFEATQIYQNVPLSQEEVDPVGRPLMHQSGEKHTTGEAVYTTDIALPSDCLYMAYITAPVAFGKMVGPPCYQDALDMPGVIGHVDWRDVPGSLMISHFGDVPVFVKDQISYHGQPIAAIVATDHETARRAAARVRVEVEKFEQTPIVTIEEAIERHSFLLPKPLRIHSSLAEPTAKARKEIEWDKFERKIEGQIRIGGQEHFYLETHNCVAIPGEGDEMQIFSSTQGVNDVQADVATVLGVPRNVITVKVRRIGGGFGGKESAAGLFAAAAAVAAKKFKKPIRLWLERFDDMAITGNRHPFRFDYRFALQNGSNNKIGAMEVHAYSNCGYSMDLSRGVMERALAHIDNVYRFGQVDVYGHLCRTNLASNTAFRGFGAPQGMFATETIMKHAAEELGLDVDELRESNLYAEEGDRTHYGMPLTQCNIRRCWHECKRWSDLAQRKLQVREWNARNTFVKRGIYMVSTKFGIAFGFKRLNQAGALVHIYADGSVLISHGGMEMGQGLHTKILQIASRCLGIDISLIQIIETATDKVPNASATAASVGSDVNGLAVKNACEILLKRLEPLRKELPENATWKELIMHAYINRVQLSTTGFATIHCEPVNFEEGRGSEYYSYCVYGVGCAEVEVDCLTGDHRVLRVDIVMDVGESLNPAIDIGQIEGAFVQGYGLFTMEELKVRPDGTRLTRGPGVYKIPSADDAPRQFHVKLLAGSSNKSGIFSSKAIGEPPLFLGSAPFFAIREAVRAYRTQNGKGGAYFRMDSPATPERIRLACEDPLMEKASPMPSKGTKWTAEL